MIKIKLNKSTDNKWTNEQMNKQEKHYILTLDKEINNTKIW